MPDVTMGEMPSSMRVPVRKRKKEEEEKKKIQLTEPFCQRTPVRNSCSLQ